MKAIDDEIVHALRHAACFIPENATIRSRVGDFVTRLRSGLHFLRSTYATLAIPALCDTGAWIDVGELSCRAIATKRSGDCVLTEEMVRGWVAAAFENGIEGGLSRLSKIVMDFRDVNESSAEVVSGLRGIKEGVL